MHAPSDIIGELLIEEQIASKIVPQQPKGQWPLFKGVSDDKPDSIITIGDPDSTVTGRIFRTGESIGPWGYQVRVRAMSYRDAQKKASEISKFFDSVVRREITIEDTVYHVQAIHQTNRAAYMGPDVNNRPNFVINGMMTYNQKVFT